MATGSCDPVSRRLSRQHIPTTPWLAVKSLADKWLMRHRALVAIRDRYLKVQNLLQSSVGLRNNVGQDRLSKMKCR